MQNKFRNSRRFADSLRLTPSASEVYAPDVRRHCSACPSYERHGLIADDGDIFPYMFLVGFLTVCLAQIWLTLAHVSRIEHMTDKLNNILETASRLRVSPWTIRRLVDRGELRGVRIGRRVLVSEREILRIIRNGTKRRKS